MYEKLKSLLEFSEIFGGIAFIHALTSAMSIVVDV
jgi:hypothetical protein